MAAAATAAAVPLDRQTCTYTACYCEENVYNLLERLVKHEGREADHMFALFISNSNETVRTVGLLLHVLGCLTHCKCA